MKDKDLIDSKITGTQVAYYIVCKRKLWLFTHHIEMEKFSDYVALGKLLSETSFKREKPKEIAIGDTLKIDFLKIGNEVIVHEVKKSKKLEEAHIWQVKFYIYKLQEKGIKCNNGVIHYPKLMRKIEVDFKKEDREKIQLAEKEIHAIKMQKNPPEFINKPYCRKCAYFDFCVV